MLTNTRTEFEAQTIAESLNAHGIPARAFGAAAAIGQWELGIRNDFQVMVRRRDLESAGSVLRAVKAESVDIDWEDVDVGEPDEARPNRTDGRPSPLRRTRAAWFRWIGWTLFVIATLILYLPLSILAAGIALLYEFWVWSRRDADSVS